jgi:hypothetical protein
MTSEPLPKAATPENLTHALRRSGSLGDGRVSEVVVESSRATILSKIVRLRLTYDGEALSSPSTVILKTGHPDRLGDANWDAGRQEVAFYNEVAAVKPGHHLLRCYEAAPPAGGSHRYARHCNRVAATAHDGTVRKYRLCPRPLSCRMVG